MHDASARPSPPALRAAPAAGQMPRPGSGAAIILDGARAVLRQQASAVARLGERLDDDFVAVVERLAACRGHVVVMGIGKSGLVGQKISATLASVGAPSFFVHATEAMHGDLGRLTVDDVVLALSNSGETAELVQVLAPLQALGVPLVAITSDRASTLGRAATLVLATGPLDEACPLNMAPTVSTTVALALGDALAMALFARRRKAAEVYARLHPGGALGRRLLRVDQIMRTGARNPVVAADAPLARVLGVMTDTPGRPGAACVVDASGKLVGLFTDGDLRRLVQQAAADPDVGIAAIMHASPHCVASGSRLTEAAALLRHHGVDQLPVVDAEGHPVGLLDVQDVLGAP